MRFGNYNSIHHSNHTLSITCIDIILNRFSIKSALSRYVAKMAVKNHSADATIASLEPLSNLQVEKITAGKPDSISSLHIGEGRYMKIIDWQNVMIKSAIATLRKVFRLNIMQLARIRKHITGNPMTSARVEKPRATLICASFTAFSGTFGEQSTYSLSSG